jgi:hypothetical protein
MAQLSVVALGVSNGLLAKWRRRKRRIGENGSGGGGNMRSHQSIEALQLSFSALKSAAAA